MNRILFYILFCSIGFFACTGPSANQQAQATEPEILNTADTLRFETETHLRNLRRLTNGGNNAEAYFSFAGDKLSFQSDYSAWGVQCDQIFFMPTGGLQEARPPMVSTGKGRTTCAFFMPGDSTILYASTHGAKETCPEAPRTVDGKYVWGVYLEFEIYVADLKGNIVTQLTNSPGYDAEATVSANGQKIVFTSSRSGDLELYTMNIDGSDVRQVTNELGYDGGAFFSPDSKKLVFRASRPKTPEAVKTYKDLLAKGWIQPTELEIFTCNVDGTDLKQITHLGKANWAPYFHPSGQKILFSSNHHSQSGRQFNIFMVDADGSNLQQVTFDPGFDAFPMFSPDGKHLVFSSNRNNGGTRDTNVFIGEWVD